MGRVVQIDTESLSIVRFRLGSWYREASMTTRKIMVVVLAILSLPFCSKPRASEPLPVRGSKETRTLPDHHGRFVWYELSTTDVGAAKTFYSEVMGWGTRDMSMPGIAYTAFTVSEAPVCGLINLSEEATNKGANPRWIGYVGVEDVDATVDRINQLGGLVLVPPTDVFDFSRFAIVADPQMATFALVTWMRSGQEPQIDRDAPGRVGWHELLAADPKTALAFYSALFGWQRAEATVGAMGTYQLFSAGQHTIGGIAPKPGTVSIASWVYYFRVGDIDAAAKRVKAGGGQVLEGPIEVPGGSWALQCVDPQHAIFALVGKRKYKAVVRFRPFGSSDNTRRAK